MSKNSLDNGSLIEERSLSKIPAPRTNTLLEYRRHNLMIIGLATVPFLFPFSIVSFIQGRYFLGVLITLVIITALINTYFIKKKQKRYIPGWCFFLITHFTVFYAITVLGEKALFWCYPVFFAVYFVAERRAARINILIAYLAIVSYSFYAFETTIITRFAFTLFLLCYFCDLLTGELTRMQENLTELANRDPLTNAFNRRHMNLCIGDVIEETKRGFGPVSILSIDVDHFKKINDNFGHEAGDKVLNNLVDTLHKRQRRTDYVFRAGGEEFVILLRNTPFNQALKLAESLREHIEQAELTEDYKLTISIGVAEYQIEESSDEWLRRADDNLYEAKNRGRNKVFPVNS